MYICMYIERFVVWFTLNLYLYNRFFLFVFNLIRVVVFMCGCGGVVVMMVMRVFIKII